MGCFAVLPVLICIARISEYQALCTSTIVQVCHLPRKELRMVKLLPSPRWLQPAPSAQEILVHKFAIKDSYSAASLRTHVNASTIGSLSIAGTLKDASCGVDMVADKLPKFTRILASGYLYHLDKIR